MKRHLVYLMLLFIVPAMSIHAGQINDTTFDNGLTIINLEDHTSPLVSLQICYHVGIKNDPPGLTGLSQIARNIILEGTADYKKGEYERIIQGGGGTTSSLLTRDYIGFSATFPKEIIDTVLFITSRLMQEIDVTYEKLVAAREAVRKQRLSYVESEIYGPLNEEIFSLAYTVHPYRNPRYGWPADVASITTDDVKKFIRSYFRPSFSTIVVAGDIDADRLTGKLNELFGSEFSPPEARQRKVVEPPHRGERISIIEGTSDISTALLAHIVCPATDRDMPAVRVLQRILAEGESSRIYRKLVYDEDLAVVTGGNLIEGEDPGLLIQFAILNYGASPDEGTDMLCSEIERMKSEYVTDAELEKAKNQIETEYYRNNSSLADKSGRLAEFQIVYGDWLLIDRQVSLARAVTKEDIREAANKYFQRTNRTAVLLLPAGKINNNDGEYTD